MYRAVLVDNEPWILDGMKALMPWGEHEFEVSETFTDPLNALESIVSHPPDLVVADIRMPEMSGLDLLHACRTQGIDCAFVFVSGYAQFEYAKGAMTDGALDYLLKPVEPSEMGEILSRLHEQLTCLEAEQSTWSKNDAPISEVLKQERIAALYGFINPEAQSHTYNGAERTTISAMCRRIFEYFVLRQPKCLKEYIEDLPNALIQCGAEVSDAADLWNQLVALLNLECAHMPDWTPLLSLTYEELVQRHSNLREMLTHLKHLLTKATRMDEHLEIIRDKNVDGRFYELLKDVESRYEQKLALHELAQLHNLNISHCCKLFKRVTGGTFSEHLIQLRLKHAHRLISSVGSMPSETYRLVGYNDYYYFRRSYQKMFGHYPDEQTDSH